MAVTRAAWERMIAESALVETLKPKAGAVVAAWEGGAVEVFPVGRGVDEATPMEIGSVTKGFTGILLAEAVLRGELALEARVDALLGESWPGEPITVMDLATHRSGLPRLSILPQRGLLGDPYRRLDRKHVLRWLKRHKPALPAQPKFGYSNFGFAVLGLVLERACGASFEQMMKERLLEPMKLGATRLQMWDGPALVARGYNQMGRPKPWHFDAYAPCGALVSTANDLVKALQMWADRKASWADGVELAVQPRHQLEHSAMGLAWLSPLNMQWHWHNGATFGYASYVGFSRAAKAGVVVLANQFSATAPTLLGQAVMRRLAEAS